MLVWFPEGLGTKLLSCGARRVWGPDYAYGSGTRARDSLAPPIPVLDSDAELDYMISLAGQTLTQGESLARETRARCRAGCILVYKVSLDL